LRKHGASCAPYQIALKQADAFSDIVDIVDIVFVSKPDPECKQSKLEFLARRRP
jgi:hypothetical protein